MWFERLKKGIMVTVASSLVVRYGERVFRFVPYLADLAEGFLKRFHGWAEGSFVWKVMNTKLTNIGRK